jgi:hypothetical protein
MSTEPVTPDDSIEPVVEPVIESSTPTKQRSLGPIIVVVIAVVCLGVIALMVWINLTMNGSTNDVFTDESNAEAETLPDSESELYAGVLFFSTNPASRRQYLAEPGTGRTLYITAGDCQRDCLDDWKPYLTETPLTEPLGQLGTVAWQDTEFHHYTWQGQPLYTFDADATAGTFYGDGFNSIWTVAKP